MSILFRIIILIIEAIILSAIALKKQNNGPYYKGIVAGVVFYYTIIPLVINLLFLFGNSEIVEKILVSKKLYAIVNANFYDMLLTGILVIVLLYLFSRAYNSKVVFSFGKLLANRSIKKTVKKDFYNILNTVGNICLFIGGICTLYYILSFGSISRALILSGYVRSFMVDSKEYVGYLASIMIIPAGIVVASPWCFLLTIDYRGGVWKKIKFLISIILSILFLLVKAGRAPLLIFVVALGMPLVIKKTKHPWVVLVLVCIICLPVLDIIDAMFDNLDLQFGGYNLISYLSQFAYPYRTSLNAFDIVNNYGLRWGQDYITTFLGLLPGFNFDSTWRIVSEYTSGVFWAESGSTPTDLFTFCIMEFHIGGLLIGSALGIVCRNLDQGLLGYRGYLGEEAYGINALESYVLLNSFWFVSTADFESLVRNMYFFGLSIIIILTTKGLRYKEYPNMY